jgi:allantoinase
MQAIRSRRIVTPEGVRAGLIVFADGTIREIDPIDTTIPGVAVTDVGTHAVLPGLIDVHTHLNEPGRMDWEGFETGTKAAAAGGYTCIVDMPLNCIPSTTSVAALKQKRAAAEGKCSVDYAFWGGVVKTNSKKLTPLANAGVHGFKCFLIHPGTDEFEMVTESELRQAMPIIAEAGLPLLVHAELAQPAGTSGDWHEYATYLRSRPPRSELEAIRLLIRLAREFGTRVHIVHLSAAAAIDELRAARAEGLPITVETCPHYLYFCSESIPRGATQFKCAPPIRDSANRAALWQALRNGIIDLIATDHSPCPPALKLLNEGDFNDAWGGISSISVSLPTMWTVARKHGFDLSDLARWMAAEPAKLAGLSRRKGSIAPGRDADFAIFDPETEFEVTPGRLHFRHPCSPYVGELLTGEVLMTYVRGQICWNKGEFAQSPCGIEV